MLIPKKIFMCMALIFLFTISFVMEGKAAPSIAPNGVTGTISQGSSVTITSSNSSFGMKSPARPLVWADFEGGSINPNSTLGLTSSWVGQGCIGYISGNECPGGTGGCVKSNNGTNACFSQQGVTLGVYYEALGNAGQTLYVYKKRKQNFLIPLPNDSSQTRNFKIFRVWPLQVGTLPDFYVNAANGCYGTEPAGSDPALAPGAGWAYPDISRLETTDWYAEEILFKASTINTLDGAIKLYYDGVKKIDRQTITRSTANPAVMQIAFVVHDVAEGIIDGRWPDWSTDNRTWEDDIYVDTTWSRVMICAGSTWANRGHCEIQIPSAWSSSSVTVAIQQGTLSGTAYLYVVDSTNTANSLGSLVTFGSSGGGSHGPSRPPVFQ